MKIANNMMNIQILSSENLDKLVEFEQNARLSESDIFVEGFDSEKFRNETLSSLENPDFASAKCLMCADAHGNIIGRLDFTILPSLAFGGDMRAYVDWVYVLKERRHKGVARFLFKHFEEYLTELGINEYFLVTAENPEAQSFYTGIKDAQIQNQAILTKKFQ